ncbi:MAG: hypothetical protein LiPW39_380 [Parcubacteria group bacterium LiPW_39]|nr:MAG: hypothetical protein LiPW39_380 [Parcubacteria group bacterium LiPW_39]
MNLKILNFALSFCPENVCDPALAGEQLHFRDPVISELISRN